MASFEVFRKVPLTLVLYLASTLNLALSETDLQIYSRTTNITHSENRIPDPRDPSFLVNVARGCHIAEGIVGHPVYLIDVSTVVPSGYPSSSVGDFTKILLSVYVQVTGEVAVLASSEQWGNWSETFSSSRPWVPGLDQIIPYRYMADYDQINAFNALPAGLGPWYIVFLRMGTIRTPVTVPIWYFGNAVISRCTFAFRNHDGTWYVGGEPMWRCMWSQLPANVPLSQASSLADANNNLTSSSSNLPLSTAVSNVSEVALSTQNNNSSNETNGDFERVATS